MLLTFRNILDVSLVVSAINELIVEDFQSIIVLTSVVRKEERKEISEITIALYCIAMYNLKIAV